jgi:hypothetical protein
VGVERTRAAFHREELAWAAGLWDGEGCCGCYGRYDGGKKKRKASYWHIRINISQHDREVLDRFAAAVGVGKVYGPYRGTVWHFQCVGKNAEIVIEKIWPWLSEPKRRQIEGARAKFEARGESTKGGHVCGPDCQCGRQKWKTEDVDPKIAKRRAQQREATRRYRAKLKESA